MSLSLSIDDDSPINENIQTENTLELVSYDYRKISALHSLGVDGTIAEEVDADMNNRDRPFAELKTFVAQAKKLGCYNAVQEGNYNGVLAVLEKQASVPTLTVGQLSDQLDGIINKYGNSSPASHESLKTYKARALKLINEFLKYNGGDFASWKAAIAKAATSNARPRPKARPGRPAEIPEALTVEELSRYPVRLTGGRVGELILPPNLSGGDVESVWKQLTALRALVEAQAEVLATDEGLATE